MQIVSGGAGSVVDEGKKRSKSATRSKPVQCFATDCGKQNGYRSSRKGFVAVICPRFLFFKVLMPKVSSLLR
jgi:hypothetical protein